MPLSLPRYPHPRHPLPLPPLLPPRPLPGLRQFPLPQPRPLRELRLRPLLQRQAHLLAGLPRQRAPQVVLQRQLQAQEHQKDAFSTCSAHKWLKNPPNLQLGHEQPQPSGAISGSTASPSSGAGSGAGTCQTSVKGIQSKRLTVNMRRLPLLSCFVRLPCACVKSRMADKGDSALHICLNTSFRHAADWEIRICAYKLLNPDDRS